MSEAATARRRWPELKLVVLVGDRLCGVLGSVKGFFPD
jgi:hypothetical protein